MLEIRLFIVGLSLLHVVCSINLELLSILEYSLTGRESTKCDLAVFGQDFAINEYHYLNRPVIQLSNGSAVAHDAFKKSSCIILLLLLQMSGPC